MGTQHGASPGHGALRRARFRKHPIRCSRLHLSGWTPQFRLQRAARVDYVSVWSTVSASAALPRALATTGRLWGDFTDEIIEAERARVIDELQRSEGNASWNASRGLEQAFNGGRPSTADEAAIARSLPADDVRAALAYAYEPEHLVLVVAGDIEPAALETSLRERLSARGPAPRAQQAEPTPFRDAAHNQDSAPVVRTHLAAEGFAVAAGFAAPPRASREYLAMLVLDQFLLGGRQEFAQLWNIERDQNSPLARRLREEGIRVDSINDGRGYGAASPPLAESDPAYFEVNFETDPATAADIQRRLVRALRAVRRNDMNAAALLSARAELVQFTIFGSTQRIYARWAIILPVWSSMTPSGQSVFQDCVTNWLQSRLLKSGGRWIGMFCVATSA